MNVAALTALVDRWRPETHTFHLRAGEMTPTLQDVSMIFGLPIQGEPLYMNTASDGWRGRMEDLIGMAPPAPEDPKERTPAGALMACISHVRWATPRGRYDAHSSKFSLRKKPRFIEPEEPRSTLKVDGGGM
ncbi:hypothetical protein QYE76_071114 [Lolium multiflorum]|uniref:Aminotransferase-like plant mobile domain-containing protein n=1 Tax=Lolium multiflorum TaxID=4521 RepID=A0AAD8SK90_LOLMU|nr:hypothetical protein QYE76_071114 [Lolium multiflorum]